MSVGVDVLILRNRLKRDGICGVTVNGNSMLPTINSGEQVQFVKKEAYQVGDVLVFYYSANQTLIVHRLVLKYGGYLYCKGDNSFGLEKISEGDVIGCVTHIKKGDDFLSIPKPQKEFIAHSLKVNLVFCQLGFDKDKMEKNAIYTDYKKKYLN